MCGLKRIIINSCQHQSPTPTSSRKDTSRKVTLVEGPIATCASMDFRNGSERHSELHTIDSAKPDRTVLNLHYHIIAMLRSCNSPSISIYTACCHCSDPARDQRNMESFTGNKNQTHTHNKWFPSFEYCFISGGEEEEKIYIGENNALLLTR